MHKERHAGDGHDAIIARGRAIRQIIADASALRARHLDSAHDGIALRRRHGAANHLCAVEGGDHRYDFEHVRNASARSGEAPGAVVDVGGFMPQRLQARQGDADESYVPEDDGEGQSMSH